MSASLVKLDSWVKQILVDPLSKEPFVSEPGDPGRLSSPYGRKYPITKGVYDLRLLNNETTADQKEWTEGQREYKRGYLRNSDWNTVQGYIFEREGVAEVYKDIALEGRCLDVGGNQGTLRAFLSPDQEYVTCDPLLEVFDGIKTCPNLVQAYPCLLQQTNFVCCDAEFLPFKSSSFKTVHMRSVIDHFLSPELALNEAYRVLEDDGALVVGLYVEGGRSGRVGIKNEAKKHIKGILRHLGMNRFKDHHVWHPTYRELAGLICDCGFTIEKVHWQKGHSDSVCYIRALKQKGLLRRSSLSGQ